ncbi:MAG: hypothetical protein QF681_02310, partial [Vicinamibacterales bacterium]|nr:hypothetical protein [Vicinamibacterales bacterium]
MSNKPHHSTITNAWPSRPLLPALLLAVLLSSCGGTEDAARPTDSTGGEAAAPAAEANPLRN